MEFMFTEKREHERVKEQKAVESMDWDLVGAK